MTRPQYRPEIDGLRAIAVIAVLFFHAELSGFSGGFVGVDVFFVISGYLITGIIAREINSGSFSLWRFYERRIRRIAPALLVVSAATVPAAWIMLVPDAFETFSESLLATVLSVSNIYFWSTTDYFANTTGVEPLLHTWSLGVEEQFYLLFPLLLTALHGRARLMPTLIVATILSFAASLILASYDAAANFYLLPTRFWELSVGALLALSPLPSVSRHAAQVLSAAGLSGIIASIILLDSNVPFPGGWALPSVLGTALVIAFAGKQTLVGRILSTNTMVSIGLISFSLYLWHQPLFAFARIWNNGSLSVVAYGGLIVASGILAYATWLWIETPTRNRTKTPTKTLLSTVSVAGLMLVGVGLAGEISNGIPQRAPTQRVVSYLAAMASANVGLDESCDGIVPPGPACQTGDAPEIVIWGDSYAMHLVAGIQESKPDVQLAQFTMSACGPFADIAPITLPYRPATWARKCLDFNQAALDYIASKPSIRYVVLSSSMDSYIREGLRLLHMDGTESIGHKQEVAIRLVQTMERLHGLGIEPVLVSPTPRNGANIGECIAQALWISVDPARCNLERHAVDTFSRDAMDVFLQAAKGFRNIDLRDGLCDAAKCRVQSGDVSIYRDSGHLSYTGSRYLGVEMRFYNRIAGRE